MPNFLKFAEQKLQERGYIHFRGEENWAGSFEEKFSEEKLASESKTSDPSEAKLDPSEVTKILQDDLDRQIVSPDSSLREYYDFYKALDADKSSYQQQYVGVGKATKQNELRSKAHDFFTQIKAKHSENIGAINLLEEDLTKKIDADVDAQVAMVVPYLMLQTITYFDQIDKIQDSETKRHFLSQFPMGTKDEYACAGGFSVRLNPILMALNAKNVHLTSAHQSAVSSSNLNRGDNVHQQAMMSALFGINLKDEHYLLPAEMCTAQELWQGYLDYHVKLQEQFLLQQEQVKENVIGLANLFTDLAEQPNLENIKKLRKEFSLNDADFYRYDEDYMPIGIDDEKVKAELEKRAKNYYPKGIDLPIILQESEVRIKDFSAPRTSEIIRDILHNSEFSQSEKNVALNYLWIRAVKNINDSNTAFVLSKVTEEALLRFPIKNITDEEIKSFFEQQEQQSLTTLEQIASVDDSTLSQDKLFLIKDRLVLDKISGKQDLLVYAAKSGFIQLLSGLLEYDQINVNHSDQDGSTALMFAAQNGHSEVVEKLLAVQGINVNLVGLYGSTALMIAAYNGHSEVVEKLLAAQGINVNHSDQNRSTALMFAARNGHSEVVEKLLAAQGIDVNRSIALMFAAQSGHSEEVADKIFKKLCKDGVDTSHIAYIAGDRPKVFSDADKISSFANQICSFIKTDFNFSAAGQEKLERLVRKSLFQEIFTQDNDRNIDSITARFAQDGVKEGIARAILIGLQSSDGVIQPSKSKLSLIPFNNPKTLNTEHEAIEGLVRGPIKEFIEQVLTPNPSSIYDQHGVGLKSREIEGSRG